MLHFLPSRWIRWLALKWSNISLVDTLTHSHSHTHSHTHNHTHTHTLTHTHTHTPPHTHTSIGSRDLRAEEHFSRTNENQRERELKKGRVGVGERKIKT